MRTLLVCALLAAPVWAQRGLEIDQSVVSQVRIDARDLGYPPLDIIPAGECAITALAVAPDGALYGATSGKRSHLFVLYPRHGYVQPLGFLQGVTTVGNALVVAGDGAVYIGAGLPGGHLLRYRPVNEERRPIRVREPLEVEDLGAPVAGEGIYTLAIDRVRNVIYGLTWPNGEFFSYAIASGKFLLHGKVAERPMPGERFEHDKNIGRALAVQGDAVWMSGENAALYCYRAGESKIKKTALSVPSVPGREPYTGVDAWTITASGQLYGGTSDGYLFRLPPGARKVENLGKPLNQYRIRGLLAAGNGKLYGIGGQDDEMARLFSYTPGGGAYELLGMIDVNRRPYYTWMAYTIGAMAMGPDGTVYIGQAERKSKLYLYYPEESR